jgi:hypothetical protein
MWRGLSKRPDYEGIKELAQKMGLKVDQLLALDHKYDPFYAGTPSNRERAEWFASIWGTFGAGAGYHVRRVHYRLISAAPPPAMPSGETYENTEKCWKYLGLASSSARHLDLVPAEDFVDRRNPDHQIHAVYEPIIMPSWEVEELPSWSLPKITSDLSDQVRLYLPEIKVEGYECTQADQPFHLEIWIEKSTMNDVLVPICQELKINLITSVGFQSITSAIRFLERLKQLVRITGQGKPVRVWYLSDYDPAGVHMPTAVARVVEFYLDKYAPDADIKLTPLVLTEEQVRHYQLPRIPIKDEDRRKAKFEDRHGEGAVELDALEALYPGELARIVRAAVEPYVDEEIEAEFIEEEDKALERADNAWEETFGEARDDLEKIKEEALAICKKYEEQLQQLNQQLQQELAPLSEQLSAVRQATEEKMGELDIDLPDRPLSFLDPPDEEGDWLFDSSRDYLEQMAAYKKAKKVSMERTVMERTCEVCGRVFTAKRSHAKVCSKACYAKGRWKKQKEARGHRKKKAR